jgi:hypothetical protein
MAENMQKFLTLAERDLSEVAIEVEQELEPQYTKIFNIGSFDGHLYRRVAKMAGFDGMQQIAEDGPVSYTEAIAPVTRRYDFITRGRGYKVTRIAWQNDEYGKLRNLEGSLLRARRDDIEQFAFGLLNSATLTTVSTGFDGLALASTAHTRLDGGAVQANRPSSLTALSLASLKDAIVNFRKLKDDRGRPYKSEPAKIVYHPDLDFTVSEILGSPDRPDTANRAINSLREVSLQREKSLYLSSTTFWALLGRKHDINVLWRTKPESKMDTDFDTQTIKRITFFDIGRGHSEWRDYYQGNT